MKKQIITAAFLLVSSPALLAAGMDCTDPKHAQMDHCKQQAKVMTGKAKQGMKGMNHSKMKHGAMQGMKGMDHSKMNHGAMQGMKGMKGMNHSKMNHGAMQGMKGMKGMDHSKMKHGAMQGMKGMDHSKMKHGAMQGMKGMDHSKMNHGAMQGMKGMNHSKMKPAIPVSDGSLPYDVPLPYNVAKMEDDPVLTKLMLNQFEIHDADGKNPLTWDAEAWIGKDINKLWLKTEGERLDGKTEDLEVQALYSRAIAPYWDFQVGLRKDLQPESREWGVLGLKGLAPYFFETDLALFAGKEGRTAARLKGEYELLLTQKTIITPEIEMNLYGKDDPAVGVGSGLSDVTVGLRLRHEIRREFAPYIGVEWTKKFGNTADFARDEGVDVSDTQFVAGIRAWF